MKWKASGNKTIAAIRFAAHGSRVWKALNAIQLQPIQINHWKNQQTRQSRWVQISARKNGNSFSIHFGRINSQRIKTNALAKYHKASIYKTQACRFLLPNGGFCPATSYFLLGCAFVVWRIHEILVYQLRLFFSLRSKLDVFFCATKWKIISKYLCIQTIPKGIRCVWLSLDEGPNLKWINKFFPAIYFLGSALAEQESREEPEGKTLKKLRTWPSNEAVAAKQETCLKSHA